VHNLALAAMQGSSIRESQFSEALAVSNLKCNTEPLLR
jgi:hypothetical protein